MSATKCWNRVKMTFWGLCGKKTTKTTSLPHVKLSLYWPRVCCAVCWCIVLTSLIHSECTSLVVLDIFWLRSPEISDVLRNGSFKKDRSRRKETLKHSVDTNSPWKCQTFRLIYILFSVDWTQSHGDMRESIAIIFTYNNTCLPTLMTQSAV